ncbi:unnamed protein product [Pedinophyceae sp. YPF-701]|nr:unnamed protein product [Pedinophyceae sp. YPF-701]
MGAEKGGGVASERRAGSTGSPAHCDPAERDGGAKPSADMLAVTQNGNHRAPTASAGDSPSVHRHPPEAAPSETEDSGAGSGPLEDPNRLWTHHDKIHGRLKPQEEVWESRKPLFTLKTDELFELPGRPNVAYMIKDYSREPTGAALAREEIPFLFKAFEVGQARPPLRANQAPRAATIHEFLDWTMTGSVPEDVRESVCNTQDFWGFRTLIIYSRFRPQYPPPKIYDVEIEAPEPKLAAPKPSLPLLLTKGKPLTAATVRAGRGYLEVPFFATVEHRKGQGFGRALLEAIEEVARSLGLGLIMLCSENHHNTWGVWEHFGFKKTTRAEFASFGIHRSELLHMDNTVQMHKFLLPRPKWIPLKIKHRTLVQRVFFHRPADPNDLAIDRAAPASRCRRTASVAGAASFGRGTVGETASPSLSLATSTEGPSTSKAHANRGMSTRGARAAAVSGQAFSHHDDGAGEVRSKRLREAAGDSSEGGAGWERRQRLRTGNSLRSLHTSD